MSGHRDTCAPLRRRCAPGRRRFLVNRTAAASVCGHRQGIALAAPNRAEPCSRARTGWSTAWLAPAHRRKTKETRDGLEQSRRELKQVNGKVKEQWGKLTDDDLDVINGRRDQLEGRIQPYGIRRIRSAGTSTTGTIARPGERIEPRTPTRQAARRSGLPSFHEAAMNQLIYLIGLIVVVLAILSFFGLR